jgi:hypothetical protein
VSGRFAAGALALAVLVTAGSTYALSGSAAPSPPQAADSQLVPTTEAALACPESPQTDHTAAALVAVTPPPTSADATGSGGDSAGAGSSLEPGALTARALAGSGEPIDETSEVGTPIVAKLTTDDQPSVIVAANGAMAPGAAAFQYSTEDGEKHSGQSAAACGAASDDWWFNGADTAVGSTSRLVLTNTTPSLAVVDVGLFGPKGAIATVGQRGIALAPNSRESVDLARFAPNLDELTVQVHATAGLVAAAVETTRVEGVTPAGSEWLPPASAPATDVVIDPAVDDSVSQDLQIVNPEDVSALVQVQVVDDTGPFVPSGLDSVRVDPGSVTTVKLGKISHNGPVAVRLTSATPVTGAVVSTTKGDDYAVSAPSPVLADSAVVPVVPDVDLALQLTGVGPQSVGKLDVTGYDRAGDEVLADTIAIDGLKAVVWTADDAGDSGGKGGGSKGPKGKPAKEPVYLVVTPELDANAQAIAVYTSKDGTATLPLEPGRFTVTRPAVAPQR